MTRIHEVFIGGRYSNTSQISSEIVIFISKLCNKLSLEIDINNYELSKEEYEKKLIKDIKEYHINEDKNRRNKFITDYNYRNQLLKQYSNEKEAGDYFDRLRNYDEIELNNIMEEVNKKVKNNTSYMKEINHKDSKLNNLFENLLIDTKFSPISDVIMGSIYKKYYFNITTDLIDYFLEKNNLFTDISVGEDFHLENPAFYINDRLIMTVTTHEHSATLFLTQEELYDFEKLYRSLVCK